ncbi:MAG: radical SAM/SPASM domain-containing protein [Candidatus Bathyarchaeia archaeon]
MPKSLLEEARRVFLEVTNHCNFRCSFCPQGISKRPPEHMDTKLAKDLINQLCEVGYQSNFYFHILGEPLLHPDIFEIVEFASERLPKSILFTNGSLLTSQNIESVFEAQPHELMISMQMIDEGSFDLRGSSMNWDRYLSGIRNAVQYRLAHNTPLLLRISVGMRKEDSSYPNDDYFPRLSKASLRSNMLELFSDIPGVDLDSVQKILNSTDIPFNGWLELASGVYVSMKPMGNWRRIYRDRKVEKRYCPLAGKEFGILSNGNTVFCHLDYDGKTTFANAGDGELRNILKSGIEKEIAKFCKDGIVPSGCQYCNVPYRHPEQPAH